MSVKLWFHLTIKGAASSYIINFYLVYICHFAGQLWHYEIKSHSPTTCGSLNTLVVANTNVYRGSTFTEPRSRTGLMLSTLPHHMKLWQYVINTTILCEVVTVCYQHHHIMWSCDTKVSTLPYHMKLWHYVINTTILCEVVTLCYQHHHIIWRIYDHIRYTTDILIHTYNIYIGCNNWLNQWRYITLNHFIMKPSLLIPLKNNTNIYLVKQSHSTQCKSHFAHNKLSDVRLITTEAPNSIIF